MIDTEPGSPGFPDMPFEVVEQEGLPTVDRPSMAETGDARELAEALYLPPETVEDMLWILKDKKSLILSGPPGVGKTYIARALAAHLADSRVNFVQFHPSYSYEYFVSGYRPSVEELGGVTYEIVAGPLLQAVQSARHEVIDSGAISEVAHVLIIDEINRANVSSVFGEVMSALEYREEHFQLQYGNPLGGSENSLSIPNNFYLIATMNRADRSVGNLDAAMWRRFGVYDCSPSDSSFGGVLRKYFEAQQINGSQIVDRVDAINAAIPDPDYLIGPSYFMGRGQMTGSDIERVFKYEVYPFLISKFGGAWLRGVISDIDAQLSYGVGSQPTSRGADDGEDAELGIDPSDHAAGDEDTY